MFQCTYTQRHRSSFNAELCFPMFQITLLPRHIQCGVVPHWFDTSIIANPVHVNLGLPPGLVGGCRPTVFTRRLLPIPCTQPQFVVILTSLYKGALRHLVHDAT